MTLKWQVCESHMGTRRVGGLGQQPPQASNTNFRLNGGHRHPPIQGHRPSSIPGLSG